MKSLAPLVIAGVMLAVAAASAADKSTNAALKAQAKVSEADARKTALARVPGGTVKSSELENEHGKLIWSFDIAAPKSKGVTEVNVDAKSGEIVAVQNESATDEKKEAAQEKAEKPVAAKK